MSKATILDGSDLEDFNQEKYDLIRKGEQTPNLGRKHSAKVCEVSDEKVSKTIKDILDFHKTKANSNI
jgi:hypothetical protein